MPRGRAPYSSSKRSQHTKKIRKTTNRGCKIVQFKHQTIKHIWQKWVASCVCCEANRRQQRQRWNTSREKTLSVCRLLQSCTGRKALMFFALDYKREGEFYCGILIFHVTLGNISITQIMASSRRKERQMIMTNWLWHLTYNLFHNKYIHFQAILSAIMMNKNLLDDKGEDQCD